MKTILIPIANSFFVRNFLRTDAFRILMENHNLRMIFLAPSDKLEYYRSEFPFKNVFFEKLPELNNLILERIFKFLENSSIHTNTVTMLQRWQFWRVSEQVSLAKRFFFFVFGRLCWHLGRFRWWRILIRKAYLLLSSGIFSAFFDRWRPDLVFAPNMIYPEDHILLREAKQRGLKTLGMGLSWDNFYSKSLIRVFPDQLMIHTDTIANQAVTYCDFPAGLITVTGIPQYDDYFLKKRIVSREEFIRSIGGDPAKKLIVYAFSGKAGLHLDFGIVRIVYDLISSGKIKEKADVLLRPYPRLDFPEKKLEAVRKNFGFLAVCPLRHIGDSKNSWEFDEKSLDLLANTLAHADLVITMYSTFFIEAAIFDKPLIGVAFDGRDQLDYWDSARRFFDWDHLAELKKFNGVWLVHSEDELAEAINKYLDNPQYMAEGRQRIVKKQAQFTDGRSGERVARTISKILGV